MRSTHFAALCLLAAACGDDKTNTKPDARVFPDASIDAPPVVECAYTEMNDAANDDFANDTPEATSISFGTTPTAICGQVNNGHFDDPSDTVDIDTFAITVPADSRGILYLTGAGAENLDSLVLEIYGDTNVISETGQFAGSFAVTSAELPAGDYVVAVRAYDSADAAAAFDYKVVLEVDSPTRCPKSTATAVTEMGETVVAVNGSNDVYEVRYGLNNNPPRKLTDLATDVPEATAITVAAGMNYLITGTSQSFSPNPTIPASWADSFQDRDTYAVTMGPTTTQLSVRVNWAATTADFDFFVFPETGVVERARGWYDANMEDEFTTLAVTPGATYRIWVGMDDASTGQPVPYSLTLCGDAVTR